MNKTRTEAFSDGVLAIIITIMVLELKVPHTVELEGLRPLWPVFLSYVMSFVYVGIYWNNHHHLLHAAKKVTGGVMWANLHLLFWLSLIPFVTGWMGENHFAAVPTAGYGVVLLMSAVAFLILQRAIMVADGGKSVVAAAVGRDVKGKASAVMYLAAIVAAMMGYPAVAGALYGLVALMWLVPDKRIERKLVGEGA
jgi:uncharacterized membrane protein